MMASDYVKEAPTAQNNAGNRAHREEEKYLG